MRNAGTLNFSEGTSDDPRPFHRCRFHHPRVCRAAIRRWSEVGFPIERLGIICKGYETGRQVVDFFNLGERVKLKGNNTCIKSPCVFSSSCAEVM